MRFGHCKICNREIRSFKILGFRVRFCKNCFEIKDKKNNQW